MHSVCVSDCNPLTMHIPNKNTWTREFLDVICFYDFINYSLTHSLGSYLTTTWHKQQTFARLFLLLLSLLVVVWFIVHFFTIFFCCCQNEMNWFSKQFTPSKKYIVWEINEIACERCEPTVQLAAICPQDIFFFLLLISASYLYLSLDSQWIENFAKKNYSLKGRQGMVNLFEKFKMPKKYLKNLKSSKKKFKKNSKFRKVHSFWNVFKNSKVPKIQKF